MTPETNPLIGNVLFKYSPPPLLRKEQNWPAKFPAHLQENKLTDSLNCSTHVPPLRHGSDAQGSSAKQHCKAIYFNNSLI